MGHFDFPSHLLARVYWKKPLFFPVRFRLAQANDYWRDFEYECEDGGHISKFVASPDAQYQTVHEQFYEISNITRTWPVWPWKNDRRFSFGCHYSHANTDCQTMVVSNLHQNRKFTCEGVGNPAKRVISGFQSSWTFTERTKNDALVKGDRSWSVKCCKVILFPVHFSCNSLIKLFKLFVQTVYVSSC